MRKKVKESNKIAKKFLDKGHKKKLRKIKDKEEKLDLTNYLIASKLKLKYHDLEIKLQKNKKNNMYIDSRMIALPSKINFFSQKPNEKDFKKILSLFDEIEKEMKNV